MSNQSKESLTPQNEFKKYAKDLVAIITGVAAAIISYIAGVTITIDSMATRLNSANAYIGIFILAIFAGVVGGDLLGRSFKQNSRPFYFLSSYFFSFLVVLFVLNHGKLLLFGIPIVVVVIIGALEWSDTIDIGKATAGKSMEISRKSLLSLLMGSANYITIQPALSIYIGNFSYVTWAFLIVCVIAIFLGLEKFRIIFTSIEKNTKRLM